MHLFDQDIALKGQGPFSFLGNIADHWSVNGNPDGGYLMAMLANAVLQMSEKKKLVILTANFISRSVPGEAFLDVEQIGSSRQFERWEAILRQDGKETVRAFGTCTDDEVSNENRYEKQAPAIAPLKDCIALPELPRYTIFRPHGCPSGPCLRGMAFRQPCGKIGTERLDKIQGRQTF